jgi:glutamine amidotransferase
MYGHLAAEPTGVLGMLVEERHALLAQSCRDWRGEAHGDGWGIGYYDRGQPQVIRRPTAAAEDPEFRDAAKRIVARAVIAHVRQASVGDRSSANAHPFTFERWIFAHNGTVTGFDKVMPALVDETDQDLRRQISGTTDSEHVFFWLLSRLARAGQPAEGPCRDLAGAANVMADVVRTLEARSAATRPELPARLNFMLTDGTVLLVSRFRHSLYWTNRSGPLVRPQGAGAAGAGVAVVSEPIGDASWAEVPEEHILTVDADSIVRWLRI